ncbi:substrate-binding domain-containing protein [Mesorhizobium sp.]|uniref:substrate-binding domain-containing protein n=1 Tax=Mesorhizobium sp. TaxID=1871066 RepID=UPI000FE2F9D8|nr:substrate-binding domain-containing protein [Mesorhizobium sp.]RWH67349.1 MAG: ribose ABC transporter substrate-binding protein [Mesorhizobium sp.]RWL23320.1 MAG: ribose ABC transporter substrate-binding protein [Mesorhizobium sp.]RWL25929.1 MAG: ribose ABC transporter substrate-binding protein [Mesorhizobium sp.]RWL32760.1 MAG: ribose ABC transporter substrate-binding protein [Mesorhizobium sp.]RWL52288.1 MAG: ribose ABC transporter substrate-binding protein [Mesorhizobium sp.]
MTNRRHFLGATALVATLLAGGMLTGTAFAEDKIKIGFSQGTMNHPWRVAMVEGNKKYAAEHYPDVDLIITDGNNDASKQVADVENLIAQGIKVLMISPLTEQALTPVVKEAMDAGIKVVTLDRKVNTPVTVHVGGENLPLGVGAGEFLAKKLNGKGNIIELQGTAGASATIDRNKGFAEAIAKFPDMKVVASQNCDYTRDKAVKFMEDMVQRFGPGQIQAVYAHNDEMALGAIQVLEAAGRLNEVAVVGIDGQETAFEAVKQGKLAATFVYPFVAPEGIETAYKVAKGEQVPPTITLPTVSVTADNIAQMIGKGF